MVHNIIKVFFWETDEFYHKEKKIDWYWWVGTITLVGTLLAIFFKNYLLAILIFLAGIITMMYANQKPDTIEISISEQGIKIDDMLYPYTVLDGFWIAQHEDGDTHLLVHSPTSYTPIYSIAVPDFIDLIDLRDYLASFLPEREMQEPFLQRISYRLGF